MDDRTKLLHSLAIDRTAGAARPRGRVRPLWTIAALAALIVAGAALWLAFPRSDASHRAAAAAAVVSESAPAPRPPAAERASSAPARAKPGGLTASGYVVARRKATVAAEITGKVTEVMIEEGMVVEGGQVLARIKSRLTETDLALAQSRAKAADAAASAIAAELHDAERIHDRTRNLAQKNFASEADMTRTEARVNVLRAQLNQARAQVETAKLEAQRVGEVLEQHSIRAPFSGVVVDRSAQAGEMISPLSAGGSFTRTGICTIVDMDSIEVEVDVNEAFIGRVHKDGAVAAVLDAYPDWTIPAYVIAIVPTANREKATVRVRIGFRQKDRRILPDMAVKVTFLDDGAGAGDKTSAAQ
jgi:RND family efflux transporter MFP subunit